MKRGPIGLLLASCLVGGAALAQVESPSALPRAEAPPRSVAVVVLASASSGFPLSEVYGAARRPLERHTALQVAPLEAIGIDERDAAMRECAGDAACFVDVLRPGRSGVELLLAVSVDRPGNELLLGLRLIDARQRAQIGATGAEVPDGMTLEGAIEDQLADVVPATVWDQVAAIDVSSVPASAEVSLGGRTCVTPCSFERLAPGPYELLAQRGGGEAVRQDLKLAAGQNPSLELDLRGPDTPVLESPWLWTAVGAGAIAAGVAAFFLLREQPTETVLCIARDPMDCE